jgi:hypothetical protein
MRQGRRPLRERCTSRRNDGSRHDGKHDEDGCSWLSIARLVPFQAHGDGAGSKTKICMVDVRRRTCEGRRLCERVVTWIFESLTIVGSSAQHEPSSKLSADLS